MAVIYRNLIIGPKHPLGFTARKLNGTVSAVALLDLAGFDKRLCLTKGHAVRTHTFASKIKSLSHIWQFHAPAMVFAGRRAAVEGRSAFITDQPVHVSLPALDKKACAMSNDHASIAEALPTRTSRTGYDLSVAIQQSCAITLPMRAWWNW